MVNDEGCSEKEFQYCMRVSKVIVLYIEAQNRKQFAEKLNLDKSFVTLEISFSEQFQLHNMLGLISYFRV